MFEFETTAAEVKSFADANDCTVVQAKQLMYREARVRYMLELSERLASGYDEQDVRHTMIEAIMFLLEREIEKNS